MSRAADTSLLIALQDRVADILRRVPALQADEGAGMAAWPVVTERVGDIQAQIEQALQSLGYGIAVLSAETPPRAGAAWPVREGIYDGDAELIVAVTVNPLMVPDESAAAVAELVIRALHGRPIDPSHEASGPELEDYQVFRVTLHEMAPEAREEQLAIHRVYVRGALTLTPITLSPPEPVEPEPED